MTGREIATAAGVAPSGSLAFSFATSSGNVPLSVQTKRSARTNSPALVVTPANRVGIGVKRPSDAALLTIAGNVLAFDVTAHAASIIEVNKTSGRETPKVLDKLRKLRVIMGSLKGDQFDDREMYLFSRRELQMQFPELLISHQGLDKVPRGKQYGYSLKQLSAVLAAAVGEAAVRIQDVNTTLARHMRSTSQWMKRAANRGQGAIPAAAATSADVEDDSSSGCIKAEDLALLENRVADIEKTHATLISNLEAAVKKAQQTAKTALAQATQAKNAVEDAVKEAKNVAQAALVSAKLAGTTAAKTTRGQTLEENKNVGNIPEARAVKPVQPEKASASEFGRSWFVAKKSTLKTLLKDGILSQEEFTNAVSAALEKFSTSN
jgi:hypothetical protein